MGCSSSKYKPSAKEPETGTPQSGEALKKGSDLLIDQIISRVSGIRVKAEEYRSQLQQQVVEIEQEKSDLAADQPVKDNGVVTASYVPDAGAGGTSLLQAEEGERIEIIVRDVGGWAYCRRQVNGSSAPGWLPATRVAELATLVANHDGAGAEGLLSLKQGDMVEVLTRHYSGWAHCREWTGPLLPGCTGQRQEGWVTDAYLEDNRSEAMLASKWHRLVLQALDQVVASARELEGVLAQAKYEDWGEDLSGEWMGQCLEFTSWLTTELGSIVQALSQHELSGNAAGAYATVSWDVVASSASELSATAGDRLLIMDADNPDWAWCKSDAGVEGWVPRNVLVVADGEGALDESLAVDDLPSWIKGGAKCRWWSTSGSRFCDVTVSEVDAVAREVKVTFVIDSSCWKTVPFDHFAGPVDEWLLQPMKAKTLELIDQLPEWVRSGQTAYWWSESQKHCLPVAIKEVNAKRRLVNINFAVDTSVKKLVPFHELIDNPETCLLQRNRKGHAWRKSKSHGDASSMGLGSEEGAGGFGAEQDLSGLEPELQARSDIWGQMEADLGDMLGPSPGAFVPDPIDVGSDLDGFGAELPAAETAEVEKAGSEPGSGTAEGPPKERSGSKGGLAGVPEDTPAESTSAGADGGTTLQTEDGSGPLDIPPVLDYTHSEQDLMDSLGIGEGTLGSLADITGPGDSKDEVREVPRDSMYNTMERELIEELSRESPSPSPRGGQKLGTLEEGAETSATSAGESLSSEAPFPGLGAAAEPPPEASASTSALREAAESGDAATVPDAPAVSAAPAAVEEDAGQPAAVAAAAEPSSNDEGGGRLDVAAPATGADQPTTGGEAAPAVPVAAQDETVETLEAAGPTQDQGPVRARMSSAWGDEPQAEAPVGPPQPSESKGKTRSDKEIQEEYLQELQREQEAEDAAAPPPSAEAAAEGAADATEGGEDFASDDDKVQLSHASALLREALRLMVPDTWDSEGEARHGRRRPDVERLSACWSLLDSDLEECVASEGQKAEQDLEREGAASSSSIEAKARDLGERLELRAKAAEAKLEPTKAQSHRSLAWGVVNAAELAKDRRRAGRTARAAIARRRALSRKEAIRRALQGGGPPAAAEPSLLKPAAAAAVALCSVVPDAAALSELTPDEALLEVAETAHRCFRALQVVALRPEQNAVRAVKAEAPAPLPGQDQDRTPAEQDGGLTPPPAWKYSRAGGAEEAGDGGVHKSCLQAACETVFSDLSACVCALAEKLQADMSEAPSVDPALETVARDQDLLTKEQRREKVMFEGQQEYDWERSMGLRMKEQQRRRETHSMASLERLERVLRRRWLRQRDKDKPRSMAQLASLVQALEDTEAALLAVRRETLQVAEAAAEELEADRRRMHEQTQVLLSAALVIRSEKARMNEARAASMPSQKQKLLKQSLRTIRRLNNEMKNFPVVTEFKQKHSVLLYSLRMLEARLQGEVPSAKDDKEEMSSSAGGAPLEETPEQKAQLAEASRLFEAQLGAELAELRRGHERKAQRAVAKEAARSRREAEEEHAPALLAAQAAIRESQSSAAMIQLSQELLRPLAMATAQLGAEHFRHSLVAEGQSEPAGFCPARKRLVAALEATLKTLGLIQPRFKSDLTALSAASSLNAHDLEWEQALELAQGRWKAFCDSHELQAQDEGEETPRGEGPDSPKLNLGDTLLIDDLEIEGSGTPPRSPQRSPPAGGKKVRAEAGTGKKPGLPPPSSRAKPAVPSAVPSGRPPSAGGTAPKTPAASSRPQVPSFARPATTSVSSLKEGDASKSDQKGAALLAQLDELTKTMDTALGTGLKARPARPGSAAAQRPATLPPGAAPRGR